MRFRTPAGGAFDLPEALLSAFAPPLLWASRRAYDHDPRGPLELRVVGIDEVEPPQRLGDFEPFDPGRTLRILAGMAARDLLPPVRVVAFPSEQYPYRVRDGFHRYHLSLVCGFSALPIAIDPWNEDWMWAQRPCVVASD